MLLALLENALVSGVAEHTPAVLNFLSVSRKKKKVEVPLKPIKLSQFILNLRFLTQRHA